MPDIERCKPLFAAEEYPADFHKLPHEARERWDELPEDVKEIIREKGAGILEVQKIEETGDGEKIFLPNSKFQPKPDEREITEEARRVLF